MADFKKRGGKTFGGPKPSFGARGDSRGGKPHFAKKSWGDRSESGPKTHYKATCSNCGDQCEVPFKPVNGKPVFCRKCFVKTEDTGKGRAGDRFQKKEYAPRSYSSAAPAVSSASYDTVVKQLEMVNAKLDKLIAAIEATR